MTQTLMNPLKFIKSIYYHSNESQARGDALALSINYESIWTPGPAPDTDPGFAGMT